MYRNKNKLFAAGVCFEDDRRSDFAFPVYRNKNKLFAAGVCFEGDGRSDFDFPAGRLFRRRRRSVIPVCGIAYGFSTTANNLYFDTQELPDCPLAKQTVPGRIVWRRNPLLTEA